jgi:hypothetical protein
MRSAQNLESLDDCLVAGEEIALVDSREQASPTSADGLNSKQTRLQPSFDCANEPHPREFPTTCASWSKANVEICIFCVNAARHNSSFVLLDVQKNRENEAERTQFGLLRENCNRLSPWLLADFPLMNFTQMQERLRVELLRRIQRGTLSVSLLARQTGFGKSHLSNFLHARRQLSLEGIDRMLAAQHMAAEDLLHLNAHGERSEPPEESSIVPVVSHGTALFEPYIRPSAVQMMLHMPTGGLHLIKSRPVATRRSWQRFVAIRIAHADALPMDPLLFPDALAVIDRHYNSLAAYRAGRPNLYAIRNGAHLKLRYADYASARLMLRPLNMSFPVDLIEIGPDESLGEYIAGRVVLTINEL